MIRLPSRPEEQVRADERAERATAQAAFRQHLLVLSDALGLRGAPLVIDEGLEASVRPDLHAGTLVIGGMFALSPEIGAVTHEIGHFMVTRDEAVGARAWGMESPNQTVINGRIYGGGVTTPADVRHECRAWAWQWLIEEAAGLTPVSAEPPLRPEATFLPGWYVSGSTDEQRRAQISEWQRQFRGEVLARTPDVLGAVRRRIQDLPRLLACRAALEAQLALPETPIETWVNDREVRATLARHGTGTPEAYTVFLETECDALVVTKTASLARAERFLACLVEANGLQKEETLAQEPAFARVA